MPVTELVRYDAMRVAIRAAHSVDEAKDIRDKAAALEAYARQANDMELERQVHDIRMRAERRTGELLREMPKSKGAREPGTNRGATPSSGTRASCAKPLSDLGISYDQSSLWQKLAEVPEDEFEAEVANPVSMPTAASIVAAHEARTAPSQPKETPVDDGALWLWGRLKDFDRLGLLAREPDEVCGGMPDHMRSTVRQIAPIVAEWLQRIPA
jgi:hypothetical protein